MLVIFGGLPGTGKTTIARIVAQTLGATYLRIDVLEHAVCLALDMPSDIGPAGYQVAYALADSNLRLGQTVIADSVNPIAVTRSAWRNVGLKAGVDMIEVEMVCSDLHEHKRRVENRISDIEGFKLPDWAAVIGREYEPWPEAHISIDTAVLSSQQAASQIIAAVRGKRAMPGQNAEC